LASSPIIDAPTAREKAVWSLAEIKARFCSMSARREAFDIIPNSAQKGAEPQ